MTAPPTAASRRHLADAHCQHMPRPSQFASTTGDHPVKKSPRTQDSQVIDMRPQHCSVASHQGCCLVTHRRRWGPPSHAFAPGCVPFGVDHREHLILRKVDGLAALLEFIRMRLARSRPIANSATSGGRTQRRPSDVAPSCLSSLETVLVADLRSGVVRARTRQMERQTAAPISSKLSQNELATTRPRRCVPPAHSRGPRGCSAVSTTADSSSNSCRTPPTLGTAIRGHCCRVTLRQSARAEGLADRAFRRLDPEPGVRPGRDAVGRCHRPPACVLAERRVRFRPRRVALPRPGLAAAGDGARGQEQCHGIVQDLVVRVGEGGGTALPRSRRSLRRAGGSPRSPTTVSQRVGPN